MSPLTLDIDPVEVRISLQQQRERGAQFETAWQKATSGRTGSDDERTLYRFMKAHFRAAYHDDDSPKGRYNIPDRDVSMAPIMSQRRLTDAPVASERCRSGDGCDRLATRGRFGIKWCERHGAELAQLAEAHFPGGGFGTGRSAKTKVAA